MPRVPALNWCKICSSATFSFGPKPPSGLRPAMILGVNLSTASLLPSYRRLMIDMRRYLGLIDACLSTTSCSAKSTKLPFVLICLKMLRKRTTPSIFIAFMELQQSWSTFFSYSTFIKGPNTLSTSAVSSSLFEKREVKVLKATCFKYATGKGVTFSTLNLSVLNCSTKCYLRLLG